MYGSNRQWFCIPLTYLKRCFAAFICASVGQEEHCARNKIVYARLGVVPVTRYMNEPIIAWYVVTSSFGCFIIPFVSIIPFGKGMDTMFEFSIANREGIVPMYRSWVRAKPSDVYVMGTLSRNKASLRSEISTAVFRSFIRVVRWGVMAQYIAMSST